MEKATVAPIRRLILITSRHLYYFYPDSNGETRKPQPDWGRHSMFTKSPPGSLLRWRSSWGGQ